MRAEKDWLHRFGEGGAAGGTGSGAGGSGSTAAASAGNSTAETARTGTDAPAKEKAPARPKAEAKEAEKDKQEAKKEDTGKPAGSEKPADGKKADEDPARAAAVKKASDFLKMAKGEYASEFRAAVKAAMMADPRQAGYRALAQAVGQRYGVNPGDLAGLTRALQGPVKDEAYFQAMARRQGMTPEAARRMDRLETENRRMKTEQQSRLLRAQLDRQARAIRADWEKQSQALKEKYPDFDFNAARREPAFADLLRRGVPVEAAYRATHFDRLMDSGAKEAARTAEKEMAARLAARASRPSENGLNAGSAALLRPNVAGMSRTQREAMERRAAHGEKIAL